LENTICHSSPNRVLLALLPFIDHKTATVRAKVAGCLLLLLQRRLDEAGSLKELDGLKQKLSKLLQDANPETRSHAREIVKTLLNQAGCTRSELELSISSDLIDKALKDNMSLTASFYSPLRGIGSFPNSALGRPVAENFHSTGLGRPSSYAALHNSSVDSSDVSLHYSQSSGDQRPPHNGSVTSKKMGLAVVETPTRPSRRKALGITAGSPGINDDDAFSGEYTSVQHSPRDQRNSDGQDCSTPSDRKYGKKSVVPQQGNRNAAKRMLESDPELLQLSSLLITLTNSKNWMDKRDAMTTLTNIVIKHHSVLREVGKLESCLEELLDRLNDGAIKV
jgi:hypothetical protein